MVRVPSVHYSQYNSLSKKTPRWNSWLIHKSKKHEIFKLWSCSRDSGPPYGYDSAPKELNSEISPLNHTLNIQDINQSLQIPSAKILACDNENLMYEILLSTKGHLQLILDPGASKSILKVHSLKPETSCYEDHILSIHGVIATQNLFRR